MEICCLCPENLPNPTLSKESSRGLRDPRKADTHCWPHFNSEADMLPGSGGRPSFFLESLGLGKGRPWARNCSEQYRDCAFPDIRRPKSIKNVEPLKIVFVQGMGERRGREKGGETA